MKAVKNVILTGSLHSGKSTLVQHALDALAFEYKGVFCQPIIQHKETLGYGIRLIGHKELHVFAHIDFQNSERFDKYGLDLSPFFAAAHYIKENLDGRQKLFVIDEIGVIEQSVSEYLNAIDHLLGSPVPCLIVVQKRAAYLKTVEKRNDAVVLELENYNMMLERRMLNLLRDITGADML